MMIRRELIGAVVMFALCTQPITALQALLLSSAKAQSVETIRGARIIDAQGKFVGVAATNGDTLMEVGSRIVRLHVATDSIISADPCAWVGFYSADCSGTPYYDAERCSVLGTPLVLNGVVAPPGSTLYLPPDPVVPPLPVVYEASYYNVQGACVPNGGSINITTEPPAVAVVDLRTLFTPPFHVVPAASCCGDCNGDGTVTIDEILTGVNHALNGCSASQ